MPTLTALKERLTPRWRYSWHGRFRFHRGRRQKKTPASGREAEAKCSRKTDDGACRRRMGLLSLWLARLTPRHDFRLYPETSCGRALFPRVFPTSLPVKTAR